MGVLHFCSCQSIDERDNPSTVLPFDGNDGGTTKVIHAQDIRSIKTQIQNWHLRACHFHCLRYRPLHRPRNDQTPPEAQLPWPLSPELDEAALYARLYPLTPAAILAASIPSSDFAAMVTELARKGTTLMLLWQEYKAAHSIGLQYSAFCERFATFRLSVAE